MGKNENRIGIDSRKKKKKEEEEKNRSELSSQSILLFVEAKRIRKNVNRDNEGKGEKEKAFKAICPIVTAMTVYTCSKFSWMYII